MTQNPTQQVVENSEVAELQTQDPDIAVTFKVSPPQVEPAVGTCECGIAPMLPDPDSILLVEDEQSVRTLARHILEASGYTVLDAANGPEALDACKSLKRPPALVVTDVVMPQMSGPALVEEVMKLYPGISVLYMSGYIDRLGSYGPAMQETPFLQKPFSPEVLANKVRQVLDEAEALRLVRANSFPSQA